MGKKLKSFEVSKEDYERLNNWCYVYLETKKPNAIKTHKYLIQKDITKNIYYASKLKTNKYGIKYTCKITVKENE